MVPAFPVVLVDVGPGGYGDAGELRGEEAIISLYDVVEKDIKESIESFKKQTEGAKILLKEVSDTALLFLL